MRRFSDCIYSDASKNKWAHNGNRIFTDTWLAIDSKFHPRVFNLININPLSSLFVPFLVYWEINRFGIFSQYGEMEILILLADNAPLRCFQPGAGSNSSVMHGCRIDFFPGVGAT